MLLCLSSYLPILLKISSHRSLLWIIHVLRRNVLFILFSLQEQKGILYYVPNSLLTSPKDYDDWFKNLFLFIRFVSLEDISLLCHSTGEFWTLSKLYFTSVNVDYCTVILDVYPMDSQMTSSSGFWMSTLERTSSTMSICDPG
jgi:hypothetical protein